MKLLCTALTLSLVSVATAGECPLSCQKTAQQTTYTVSHTPMTVQQVLLTDHHKKHAEKNIVETAVGADDFNTLVAAVKAAGLVDALSGEGPLTVFAPTDAAFAKVDEKTLNSLLKPKNQSKLQAILKYHVVAGKVLAADVVKLAGKEVVTLEGSTVDVKVADGAVSIDNATVVTTDIICSNGVIHIIDAVIMP